MEKKLHFSSISPKTAFYNSNGTGRDTYIVVDSGGCIKHQSSQLPSLRPIGNKSNFSYKDHRVYHSVRKNNNITHYKSDGSGRDQYILINEGGLAYPYESKNHYESLFSNSLRNYDKLGSSITNLKDYFTAAQRCKTPKEVSQQKQLKMSQRNLILRLTTSKDKERCRGYRNTLFY